MRLSGSSARHGGQIAPTPRRGEVWVDRPRPPGGRDGATLAAGGGEDDGDGLDRGVAKAVDADVLADTALVVPLPPGFAAIG